MGKKLKIITGNVILPHRIIDNASVLIDDGIIKEVSEKKISTKADVTLDAQGNYVSPGFIDIHIHGGGGSDFMDGKVKDFLRIAETHLQHGTTSMVPTTLTAEKEDLLVILSVYRQAYTKNKRGAQFLGMHIEGPYFAINQKGAQDARYIRKPDKREYSDIIKKAGDVIVRWSAAPELEGAQEFGSYLTANNILPAIAHTDAVYEDVVKAFENGYSLATHFYSAMSGVTRRNAYRYAGVIESVYLMDAIDVEIIADGVHLPSPLLKLIYKIKGPDRIALITDAMRAAAVNTTESILGSKKNGMKVLIEDGVAKLPDRSSFAGSVATTDRLVRTMTQIAEIPLVEVIRMMTLTPARIMKKQNQKGSIAVGKDADIVIFDENINIQSAIVGGEVLYNIF
ncbi:MAG: N-acetylglucosamine-6-phosphate deacetylase [Bacteroidota bacterium]|nr:N-acetylglucosamine-6-phosphate deacetylase [Bacteroidota bacterium]